MVLYSEASLMWGLQEQLCSFPVWNHPGDVTREPQQCDDY